jgi:snRNA-activating protein complex subunit 3
VYSSKSMEGTLFRELSIRVGAEYLYVHRGNCQHSIVFTEMRLITDSDNKDKNAYPLHIFQCKIRRKKCKICDIYAAKYDFAIWFNFLGM